MRKPPASGLTSLSASGPVKRHGRVGPAAAEVLVEFLGQGFERCRAFILGEHAGRGRRAPRRRSSEARFCRDCR